MWYYGNLPSSLALSISSNPGTPVVEQNRGVANTRGAVTLGRPELQ
jgi:hypothetical protein